MLVDGVDSVLNGPLMASSPEWSRPCAARSRSRSGSASSSQMSSLQSRSERSHSVDSRTGSDGPSGSGSGSWRVAFVGGLSSSPPLLTLPFASFRPTEPMTFMDPEDSSSLGSGSRVSELLGAPLASVRAGGAGLRASVLGRPGRCYEPLSDAQLLRPSRARTASPRATRCRRWSSTRYRPCRMSRQAVAPHHRPHVHSDPYCCPTFLCV